MGSTGMPNFKPYPVLAQVHLLLQIGPSKRVPGVPVLKYTLGFSGLGFRVGLGLGPSQKSPQVQYFRALKVCQGLLERWWEDSGFMAGLEVRVLVAKVWKFMPLGFGPSF